MCIRDRWGIELIEEAVADAIAAARRNEIPGVQFFAGDTRLALPELVERAGRPDVVVVDPPRAGLSQKVEMCIRDSGPCDRIGDRLLDELDPPDLSRVRGERERDRADPRVEVIDPLPALQGGVGDRYRVQPLGHLGVGLEERLRRDPQVQLADPLVDVVDAGDQLRCV